MSWCEGQGYLLLRWSNPSIIPSFVFRFNAEIEKKKRNMVSFSDFYTALVSLRASVRRKGGARAPSSSS